MTPRCIVVFLISAILFSGPLASGTESSNIGFESVDAALIALKKDPNSSVTTHDDWTIIQNSEDGNMVLWSFTPPTHPAHPAAIKRTTIEEGGAVYLHMTALCEATKSECDNLIQQFKTLNDQILKNVNAAASPEPAHEEAYRKTFISSPEEKALVEDQIRKLSVSYLADVFDGSYEKAYASFSTEMKSYQSFDTWSKRIEESIEAAGPVELINVHSITVYDNPPNSPRPGLYVAADYQNRLQKAPYHCGFLVWFRAESGDFEIVREETGLVSLEDLKMIPEESLEDVLAQMRCNAPL